jgi:hypothetical protein
MLFGFSETLDLATLLLKVDLTSPLLNKLLHFQRVNI